ncbi:MAG: nuclear transport factor 2 family protein [Caulobacteraceae bacterium]
MKLTRALLALALLAPILMAPGPSVAAPAPRASVEQRLRKMEDESAIRRILVQYGAFLDAKDFVSYAALFARDGERIGGFGRFKGPAAIQKMLEEKLGKAEPGYINKQSYHLMSNPIIMIDGDRAKVTSKYLFVMSSADNKPVPTLAGRYVDDFVRENGRWKVLRRVTHGVIPYRNGDDPVLPPPPASIAPIMQGPKRP